MNVKIVHDPEDAIGIAVIIDVFRAFSVEAYIMQKDNIKLITVGKLSLAYKYKEKHPDTILIGERRGIKISDFDFRKFTFSNRKY